MRLNVCCFLLREFWMWRATLILYNLGRALNIIILVCSILINIALILFKVDARADVASITQYNKVCQEIHLENYLR